MRTFIAYFTSREDEHTFRIMSDTFTTAIEKIKDHYCLATCISIDLESHAVSGSYCEDIDSIPYLGE